MEWKQIVREHQTPSEVNEDDDDDDDDTDAVCYLLTMMTCQSLSVTI